MPYVLPFVALISSVIGTDGDPVYDTLVPVLPAVCEATVFVRGILEEYAETGRPLWPPVPSSLYAAFLARDITLSRVVVISWDASVRGWGALVRSMAHPDGKVIVGTLPDTEDMQHQPRRETLGGVLAFEAASRELDLADTWVIMRTTASPPSQPFGRGASRPRSSGSAPCASPSSSGTPGAMRCSSTPPGPNW